MWSPEQYRKFGDERGRAFFDLLARVPIERAGIVADLGCGPGDLTIALSKRFAGARVIGVDSSPAMIAAGAEHARQTPGLELVLGDLAIWDPPAPLDLVFANASFHWVAEHERLLEHWIAKLAPGGCIAFQMPGNFEAPSHTLLRRVRESARYAAKLGNDAKIFVAELAWYTRFLAERGLHVDAWETTYQHVLQGEDAVPEWTSGTALRPVLAKLDASEQVAFKAEYGSLLRAAYPKESFGTLFPFRRLFVVATR